jgi:hypothetical protein
VRREPAIIDITPKNPDKYETTTYSISFTRGTETVTYLPEQPEVHRESQKVPLDFSDWLLERALIGPLLSISFIALAIYLSR